MSGGHRGKGARWYARHQPQKSKGGMRCNSPASSIRRGGGKDGGMVRSASAAMVMKDTGYLKVWIWLFAPSAAPKGRRRCETFRRVENR